MIDLHTHTTASDGSSTPDALVTELKAAGVTTFAVTDHDTLRAIDAARTAAASAGLTCITGVEITAVHAARDVHVLGYFFDPAHDELARFLETQRADRRRRVLEIGDRLRTLGVPVDVDAIVEAHGARGRAAGRPAVAAALVRAGYARDLADAFDRYLADGRPACVKRRGAAPEEVIGILASAGGLASLAHPGKMGLDALIPTLAAGGLAALEVYHPDHSSEDTVRYRALADAHGLLVTGGSDYHGRDTTRGAYLGKVGLTAALFQQLGDAAAARRTARR